MNPLVKFFHELFNPHCEHCEQLRMQELEQKEIERELAIADKICSSCENLKIQLAVMNQLVDKLTTPQKVESLPLTETTHKVILPQHIPWRVTREMREKESRLRAAEILAEASIKIPQPDSIEKLESELGISNGTEAKSN